MKVKQVGKDKSSLSIQIEAIDELWYVSEIISPGDIISAPTERKIQVDAKAEESATKRVKVTLGINAEKIEFLGDSIKILGTIVESPDFISRGDYHSLYLTQTTHFTLKKAEWSILAKKRLEEAQNLQKQTILIVRFDREEAMFSLVKARTVEPLVHMKGSVQKKAYDTNVTGDFYKDIIKQIEEYNSRYNPDYIIIGAQPFWQQEFKKRSTAPHLAKKYIFAESDYLKHSRAIDILFQPEVKSQLSHVTLQNEQSHVSELFRHIAHDSLGAYGKEDVAQAAYAGAIKQVLVTDGFIRKCQEEGTYDEINQILSAVEAQKGTIDIIQSDRDHGKQVDGLGGIAAILRYPVL
jgi:protein pelota